MILLLIRLQKLAEVVINDNNTRTPHQTLMSSAGGNKPVPLNLPYKDLGPYLRTTTSNTDTTEEQQQYIKKKNRNMVIDRYFEHEAELSGRYLVMII